MSRKNHKMENGRMPRKEEREIEKAAIHIIPLDAEMSVCKVEDYSGVDLTRDFCFVEKTDEENSLVCQTAFVPENTTFSRGAPRFKRAER